MTKTILYLYLLLSAVFLSAQQEELLSQYTFNRLPFNPAFSGFNHNLQLIASHRSQWAGLKGAPESQYVTLNRGYQNTPHGWGVMLGRMTQGIQTMYDLGLSYGFELRFKKRSIYLGARISAQNHSIDYSNPDIYAADGFIPDPLIERNKISSGSFNSGIGLLYRQNGLYAGFSISNILENAIRTGNENIKNEEKRHFYAMMGADIKLNNNWDYQAGALFKITANSPYNIDILNLFEFKNYLFLGLNMRSGGSGTAMLESMNLLAGLQVSEKVFGSISYDITASELRKVENGSIELLLRYTFPRNHLTEINEDVEIAKEGILNNTELKKDNLENDKATEKDEESNLISKDRSYKLEEDSLLDGRTIIFENIYYAFDSYTIEEDAVEELDALADFIIKNDTIKLKLISYTDSRGEIDYNKRLSNKRAVAVKAYLVNKGAKPDNILSIGMGESKIRNRCKDGVNCSEEEHNYNRRTEVQVINQ